MNSLPLELDGSRAGCLHLRRDPSDRLAGREGSRLSGGSGHSSASNRWSVVVPISAISVLVSR